MMSECRTYVRKHKRKEQCCSILVTPEKPNSRRRLEIKEVYGRRKRMKSCSNEKNIDCDKSSEIGFKTISCVEKDGVFDPCMAFSDKDEERCNYRTENLSLGFVEQSFVPTMQTDEGGLTCLVSAATIEGLNTLDSVMNRSPFEQLSCLLEPKVSQPYAMSQDNGFMRENVYYDQILANGCLDLKKRLQKPKRKIHRPKVARDRKTTAPKQAMERKPKLATPKQAKEKKSKNVRKKASLGLKDDIIETNNLTDFESMVVIEINETKAPVAKALDFRLESLNARLVESSSICFPIKKKRSKRRRRLNWCLEDAVIETKNLTDFKSRMVIEINATKAPVARALDFRSESSDARLVESGSLSFPIKKKRSKSSRRRLNWFSLCVKSVTKCVKQRKLFTVNWYPRKRRIRMKRPQKVSDVDAKTNAEIHNKSDKTDLSEVREIDVLEMYTLFAVKEIEQLETDALTAGREIKVLKIDTPFTVKGKLKARTLKATVKPRGRREFSFEEELDSLIHKMLSLNISGNKLVPYQGPLQPLKKIKPKVDLHPDTVREWNLLVGIDVDRTRFETSNDTEKQWENDRKLFDGRVASFINRLQPIQGNRSFRKWKGSVLDSTIGVILTQNVTDAFSSNAFMSVAAKFTPKPVASESDPSCSQESVGSNMTEYEVEGIQYFVTEPEPEPEKDKELEKATNGLVGVIEETRINTGCEGCLQVISCTNSDLSVACESIVQSRCTKLPKVVRVKIPKLRERDYLDMGFGERISTSEKESDSKEEKIDWESLKIRYSTGERSNDQMDAVDWEAVRLADVNELAACIKERGQHNILASKIQDLLNRLVSTHNCLDLEWLRNTPPDLAKRYLLEINGLGLKSVECIRLLSLEQVAFPVDVNVARIVVRLGWVPLKPLPEHLELHLLEQYPILDDIQIYLWPRLCKLPQRILYKLHYHMITFGKVICTKSKPKCEACPMTDHCRHFQSQYASANKTLPSNEMKSSSASASASTAFSSISEVTQFLDIESHTKIYEPIIEEPFEAPTPVTVYQEPEYDSDETEYDSDGIPIIKLNVKDLKRNNLMFVDGKVSNALVALNSRALPAAPKLKRSGRLTTTHTVYELPRNHILLQGLEQTKSEDDLQYHLAIWEPDETINSLDPSKNQCNSTGSEPCDEETCFSGNNIREQEGNNVWGTLLIPCREANRSRFPLNGTYFQLNEVFADHKTSYHPIAVPGHSIYNLRTRRLYCGTSISAILRDASTTVDVYECFNKGIICIRGFEMSQRAPRPLAKRFHTKAGRVEKVNKESKVNVKKAILPR